MNGLEAVAARGLTKTFGGGRHTPDVQVLRGIDLSVAAGEMIAIVGPSGSGKSTLMHCLAGLESASDGTVELLGSDLATLNRGRLARLRRDHVGFVFQSYNLIGSLSVRDNVALPMRLARQPVSWHSIQGTLDEVGLAGKDRRRPSELSGGEQQRVALARVLAVSPDVVFADEPTGALDTRTGADVLDLLRTIANRSHTVVLATHDLGAASRADRVVVMRDGTITATLAAPTPDAILAAMSLEGVGRR
jgi:putative ABC transport system ATP-binding protein